MGKEPGPGPESEPELGSGPRTGPEPEYRCQPEPETKPEPATESQKTAANNQLQGKDVEDVLPSTGNSHELQPQAPGEILTAAAAAVLPSCQGGAMGSESTELKGEESESTVPPSESEVQKLNSSSR